MVISRESSYSTFSELWFVRINYYCQTSGVGFNDFLLQNLVFDFVDVKICDGSSRAKMIAYQKERNSHLKLSVSQLSTATDGNMIK